MCSSFISNAWQSGEWRHRQKIMGEKDLPRKKKYGLYHILTDELRLFDKEHFFRFVRMSPQRFRFVRMTPQRFEHLLSLVGPRLQRTTTKMRGPISPAESLVLTLRFDSFFSFGGKKFQWKQIVAYLAGIFVECSFKFISRLNDYDKIF